MEPLVNDEITDSKWKELRQRSISGVLVALLVIVAVIAGGLLFQALIVIAALLMLREWDGLTEARPALWKLVGLAYVALPCLALLWLRDYNFLVDKALTSDWIAAKDARGRNIVMYLLLVVIATDVGAYFAGRHFGGPKLAPAISPGKTWAGLLGGVAAAGGISLLCAWLVPFSSIALVILLGMLLAVVAQTGDLFESWLKRRAGVKDSGSLIPGHGGILDRVDGYSFTAPLLALLVALFG